MKTQYDKHLGNFCPSTARVRLLGIPLDNQLTKRQSGNGIGTLPIPKSQGGSELARCIA